MESAPTERRCICRPERPSTTDAPVARGVRRRRPVHSFWSERGFLHASILLLPVAVGDVSPLDGGRGGAVPGADGDLVGADQAAPGRPAVLVRRDARRRCGLGRPPAPLTGP